MPIQKKTSSSPKLSRKRQTKIVEIFRKGTENRTFVFFYATIRKTREKVAQNHKNVTRCANECPNMLRRREVNMCKCQNNGTMNLKMSKKKIQDKHRNVEEDGINNSRLSNQKNTITHAMSKNLEL